MMFDRKEYAKQWYIENKEITKKRAKEWKKDNSGKVKEWNRIAARKRYNENPKKYRDIVKNHRKSNSERLSEHQKEYRKDNQEKIKAQRLAITVYPISQTCSVVGCNEIGERHHPDYSKPLDIVWLCKKHHEEIHRKIREEKRQNGIAVEKLLKEIKA